MIIEANSFNVKELASAYCKEPPAMLAIRQLKNISLKMPLIKRGFRTKFCKNIAGNST